MACGEAQSPQSTRWSPMIQMSPGWVTGSSGMSGISGDSSSSISDDSLMASSIAATSSELNPAQSLANSEGSAWMVLASASSSHSASSAVRLSAMAKAVISGPTSSERTTLISSQPRSLAAW